MRDIRHFDQIFGGGFIKIMIIGKNIWLCPQEIALPPSPQECLVWTQEEGELAKQMQRLHKRSPEADPSGKSPLTQLKVTQLFCHAFRSVTLSDSKF